MMKVCFVKTSNQGKPWCCFRLCALEKIQISFSLLIAPPPSLTMIGRNRFGTSYFLFIFGYLKFSIYLNLFSLKKITDLYLHVKESLSSWEKCIRNVPFLFVIKVVKLARLKQVIINNLISLDLLRKKGATLFLMQTVEDGEHTERVLGSYFHF